MVVLNLDLPEITMMPLVAKPINKYPDRYAGAVITKVAPRLPRKFIADPAKTQPIVAPIAINDPG